MRRATRLLAPAAGPALIVVGVLVVLHAYVGGRATAQAGDPLAFFLPAHCFLGEHLARGDIPLWNRHVMGGVPFAADPQSGWTYLPAMLLYTALPCHVAFGWYVALHPALAGVGLSWFLREEGLSRTAATTGGVALALPLAASSLATGSLPLSASIAWIAVLLAAGARYRRAAGWPSRLGWALAVAVAWGQLAAAHLSTGLVLGTAALAVSLGSGLVADVRAGRRGRRDALLAGILLVVALPLVNGAVLLPRLAYLPRTTLGMGYGRLAALASALTGVEEPTGTFGTGVSPRWPLGFALAPGYYVGAALAPVFVAFASRRHRRLAVAFGVYGAACFALALSPVVGFFGPAGGSWWRDQYLHSPSRLLLGLLVAVAVLAGVGVDAWRERAWPGRRWAWPAGALGLSLVVWVALPLAWSDRPHLVAWPVAGVAAGGVALAAAALRPGWLRAVPALAAVGVAAGGLAARTDLASVAVRAEAARVVAGDPEAVLRRVAGGVHHLWADTPPDVRVADYVRPGRIARAILRNEGGRHVSLDPPNALPSGYIAQRPERWGMLASHQSMVLGIETAQGYNPVQLPRYWMFVRAADPKRINYNRAWFLRPSEVALDVLQVTRVIAPDLRWVPAPDATVEARQGRWTLFRLPGAPPRASVHTGWSVAPSAGEALRRVTGPAFDPTSTVVVEGRLGSPPAVESPTGRPDDEGWARFGWLGTDSAHVEVSAPAPAVVLVRNAYDRNWRATVEGEDRPVLPGDFVAQAVPVPAGRHTVVLRYEEPWVARGLAVSLLSAAALLAVAQGCERRRPTVRPASRWLPRRGR